MTDQSGFLLILALAVVTTAVITALFLRPEWFGLGDDYNPEEVKKHD